MELLQLKYFCDAAETENFTRTAQKYIVPASNISQSVHRLETELGVRLFIRSANKIRLSEQGKCFYTKVKKALLLLEDAKSNVKASDNMCGEIRILIETNRRSCTRAIEEFKEKYNGVNFLINHNSVLNDRNYDFIISSRENAYGSFEKKLLISEKIAVAIPKNHRLAGCKKIEPSLLKNESFITMHEKSSMHLISRKICNDAGFEPDFIIKSDDPFYVRKYVEMGLGIALFPEFSWRGLFSDDVTVCDIGDYKRNTYVFFSKYKTEPTKLFLEMLEKSFM